GEVRRGEQGQGHDAEDVMAARVVDVHETLGPSSDREQGEEEEIETGHPQVLRHGSLLSAGSDAPATLTTIPAPRPCRSPSSARSPRGHAGPPRVPAPPPRTGGRRAPRRDRSRPAPPPPPARRRACGRSPRAPPPRPRRGGRARRTRPPGIRLRV